MNIGQQLTAALEDTKAEKVEEPKKKRMTDAIKVRCAHLKHNGLNDKAIAETVGFDESIVTKALGDK
jgi:hypothetical protein